MSIQIEIQKGIPIPPRQNGKGQFSELTLTMKRMEIGDCIDLPVRKTNLYAKARVARIKFTVRTIQEQGRKFWRVWRVE